jgi:hypothetical protein
MIVLFSILLFSKSDFVLVLCCIYLRILIASMRRVQEEMSVLGSEGSYIHCCLQC